MVPTKVAWVPRHVGCKQLRVGQSWGRSLVVGGAGQGLLGRRLLLLKGMLRAEGKVDVNSCTTIHITQTMHRK